MKKSTAGADRTPHMQIRGVHLHRHHLDSAGQVRMLDDLRRVVAAAPLFCPVTARGQAMSVRMTSAGAVGWVSDRRGYRYQERHPQGMAWPEIPRSVLDVWKSVAGSDREPDSCLVNYYDGDARMGMHQDRDEADLAQPVVSVSLGDQALFRIGNLTRGGKTESLWLDSGDVLVMRGAARLIYHGVDRIRSGSSMLLPKGGRVNLTLRVAR